MMRLQQGRRQPMGFQQSGRGLVLAGGGCGPSCGCSQCGSGIFESIRAGLVKGKELGSKLSDLATGEFGTSLRNLIPSSDENARDQFPGEKHAVLRLPNGKFGMANYMGPGTHLEERLARGDPPRTMSDKVAQAHDSRYGLAKTQSEVAAADRKMISKLQDMRKKRQDARVNIEMGLRPIQAKLQAERFGLVQPGAIASFGDVNNRALVSNKLKQLEQAGFGDFPGQALKMKLLKQGSGKKSTLTKTKVIDIMGKLITDKLLPILLAKMQPGLKFGGQGLKLSGQGKLKKLLTMRMSKAMKKCSNSGKCIHGTPKHLVGRGIIPTGAQLKQMALNATKTMLPILIKLVLSKAGLEQSGNGRFVNRDGRTVFQPSTFNKLTKPLNDSLLKALKMGLSSLFGNGMVGEGFFDDFGRGFMTVWSPILKTAKTLAPLAPLLL
jgi:hypothetical protein